jgi:hypothetical protein
VGSVQTVYADDPGLRYIPSTGVLYANVSATGNVSAGNIITAGTGGNITGANVIFVTTLSATGNITGSYIIGNGSQLTGIVSSYGNANVSTLLSAFGSNNISTTGNITGGNLSVGTGTITVGTIVNSNANGVGNIGSSTTYFNTVFAKATSAQYADLAETYDADADYAPGTVVVFGGEKEITVTTTHADARVAGAISTEPAYLMNSQAVGLPVALRGRIPVNVIGPVTKGDSLVTSTHQGFAESIGVDQSYGQAVFAKALETNLDPGKKTIITVIL